MAACMAAATGIDKNRIKNVHRLGSDAASVSAQTWATFATAFVRKDGSGYVAVKDEQGQEFHRFDFGPEKDRR